MGFLSFEVNNQRRLELDQTKHDGEVKLYTYDPAGVAEATIEATIIPPGDFVMLINHYRNCMRCNHPIVLDNYEPEPKEDWFGKVRWCDDDIVDALQFKCINPTDEKVSLVRRQLEHHGFQDHQIGSGWDYIYSTIDNLNFDEDGEPLVTYRVYFNGDDETEVDARCEDEAVEIAKAIAEESGVEFELDEVECLGVLV